MSGAGQSSSGGSGSEAKSSEHGTPAADAMCAICMMELSTDNYIEYKIHKGASSSTLYSLCDMPFEPIFYTFQTRKFFVSRIFTF